MWVLHSKNNANTQSSVEGWGLKHT